VNVTDNVAPDGPEDLSAPPKSSGLLSAGSLRDARLWFGVAVSAGSIYLLSRGVSWGEVLSTLGHLQVLPALLAVLIVLVTGIAKAERWRWLFWPHQKSVGRVWLYGVLLAGQMINFAFPSRLGEVTRVYYVGRSGQVQSAHVLTSIAVEKTVDLVMTLALLAALLSVMPVPEWLHGSVKTLSLAVLALLLILFVLTWQEHYAGRWLAWPIRFFPARFQEPARRQLALALAGLLALRQGKVLVEVCFWSIVVWTTSVWTNYLVFQSLGLELSWKAALFLLLILMLGTAIPSSPGKIGVFHYLTVLGLAPFAVAKPVALSVALVLYVVAYGPVLVGGSAFVLLERRLSH